MGFRLYDAFVIVASLVAPVSAIALPTFSSVTSGSATFVTNGNALSIQTAGDTMITWNSFSIDLGESVTFLQSDSQHSVFNTLAGAPAQIYGSLATNGGLILQSGSGIFVGGSGMINSPSLSLFSGQGAIVIENSM